MQSEDDKYSIVPSSNPSGFISSDPNLAADGLALLRYFGRIASADSRMKVIALAKALEAEET